MARRLQCVGEGLVQGRVVQGKVLHERVDQRLEGHEGMLRRHLARGDLEIYVLEMNVAYLVLKNGEQLKQRAGRVCRRCFVPLPASVHANQCRRVRIMRRFAAKMRLAGGLIRL